MIFANKILSILKTDISSQFSIAFVSMNSKRILTLRWYNWLLTLILVLLCIVTPIGRSQIDGCAALLQSTDIQQCLAQSSSSMYIQSSCCKSLNHIVQAGFYCLCSLLKTSTIGLVSPSLMLPFSNCYISVPPLNLCQEVTPVPVLLSPESPKEQAQLPSPPKEFVPSPPHEVQLQVPPSNVKMDDNSITSSATSQQHGNENNDDDPRLCVLSNGANNTRMCLWHTLLLLLLSLWIFMLVCQSSSIPF